MTDDCKYMRTKYNYTPNDFDLYFDFTDVPSNINMNDAISLKRRLQQVMPLSKVIHLHFNTGEKNIQENIGVFSTLIIDGTEVKII